MLVSESAAPFSWNHPKLTNRRQIPDPCAMPNFFLLLPQISIHLCIFNYSPYLCSPYFWKRDMANHKSAEKRIRANETKRLRNRYQHKTARTVIKKLKSSTEKSEATELLKQVSAMIDKLAKNNIIHWKKAANQKSKLTRFVNGLEKK